MRKQGRYWLILSAVALGLFFISGSHVDAKIEIKGDDDFKKAAEECLKEYEKIGGELGTITKRLKDSKNEHVIEEGADYTSTPSDAEKAGDGTGSGSHTRVSKKDWDEFKKKFDSLKSKDFCAVLIHELWHAADADRGEYKRGEKKDDIPVDEFEAVLIQNIYHKAKGLSPRETYGGKKVPDDVKLPEWVAPPAGAPKAAVTPPPTKPEPKPTPEPGPTPKLESEPLPPPELPPFTVSPRNINKVHMFGKSACPDPFQSLTLSGPAGHSWSILSSPAWVSFPQSSGTFPGTVDTELVSMQLQSSFPCSGFTGSNQSGNARFQSADSFFDVFFQLEIQGLP